MGKESAAGAVATYLREQCEPVLALTAAGLTDPETVHDTRVALRRLRSTVRTFAGLFEPGPARRLDREARWLAGLLGELRDPDVLAERIADQAGRAADLTAAEVAPVLADLADQRERALAVADRELGSPRFADLRTALKLWRDDPPLRAGASAAAAELVDRVRQAGRTEKKRVRRAARDGADDETLHRARKAAKRHRYALELEDRLPRRRSAKQRRKHRRRARYSRKLHQRLGRHQDAVVAAEFLASRSDTAPEPAAVRRRLLDRERAVAEDTRLA